MSRYSFLLLILLIGCAVRNGQNDPNALSSIQFIDRNGFTETISQKDRLQSYQPLDFLAPQPHQKILRVYGRNEEGKIKSKVTSYHPNGQIWQYLDVVDGRAHGDYKEWHPNGQLKIEACVIEGMADLHSYAQMSWLFDGPSTVWDEKGNVSAKIFYEKGVLNTQTLYYHPNGQIWKEIPYRQGVIDGVLLVYDENRIKREHMEYAKGVKHGLSFGLWDESTHQYREEYEQGALLSAFYFNPNGEIVGKIDEGEGFQCIFEDKRLTTRIEFQKGIPEGKVEELDDKGNIVHKWYIKGGKKEGEEWAFYPSSDQPKLQLYWRDDAIQGMVKTWYPNGMLESQREINSNKKHGLSFGWYQDGQLMLSEEYENDLLVKGSYFKKGDKNPVSRVEEGRGITTLFDSEGNYLRRVHYEKGTPQSE